MKKSFLSLTLSVLALLHAGIASPLNTGPGQPPILQVLDGSLGQLSKDSFNIVSDTLFFNHAGSNGLSTSYPVRNNVTFRINPYSLYSLQGAFTATVRLELTLTAASGSLSTVDTSLTVRYNKDSAYTDQDSYIFSNAYSVKVKILDRSTDATWDVWKVLKLDNELQSFPVFTFDCTNDTILAVTHASQDSNSTADELPVSWAGAIGADQYDLEWTYIDSSALAGPAHLYGSPSSPNPSLIFDNNSSRVTVTGTSYNIPIFYDGAGTLFFRVRPVQLQAGGGRTEGHWTSDKQAPGSYYFKGHQRNLNWQSTASYAEEGKRKVVVQYYDGSLRGRQTVTKDNTTNTTIVSESYYDYQGRPVIQVLPSPTFQNVIKYSQNFNMGLNGAAYDKNDFDSLADATQYCNGGAAGMDTTSGASQYYSAGNPDKDSGIHQFIPNAQRFPFTQVEYLQDNTGRISRQSGVGPAHQLGSGHETQYFYGTPDQHELDALFGTEVGDRSHYFKTMVRDANGQISVSYTDMHGRTIATALAGLPDGATLDTLATFRSANITETLSDPTSNVIKDLVMESKKGLVVAVPGNHAFTYKLNPASLQMQDCNNTQVCYDCLYDLEITITDDCNNQKIGTTGAAFDTVFHNFTLGGRPDTTCSKAADTFAVTFTKNLPVGSYEITKRLSVSRYGENYYRDSVFMKRNSCRNYTTFLQEQKAIEASITQCQPTCQSCQDSLGTWSQYYTRFITHAGIATGDSSYKGMILNAYQQAQAACRLLCDSVNEADDIRAAMLLDMTPPSGQYANVALSSDIYSIYYVDTNSTGDVTDTAKYMLSANKYLDENGHIDSVYDESSGNTVRPQDLSPETFSEKFKLGWAEALLPYHPEYNKLVLYETLPLSPAWDRRFEAVDTYAEALSKGYMNPSHLVSGTTYSRYDATGTSDYDPLSVTYSGYSSGLATAMTQFFINQTHDTTRTLWQMATAAVRCAGRGQACAMAITPDSAFNSNMCTGELDMAWRNFRQSYLDIKRKLINAQLNAAYPTPTTATLLAHHQPHFTDAGEVVQALNLVPSIDPGTVEQQNQVSISNYYDSTCRAYVTMWWQDLAPCNYNSADSAIIIPRLIQVCKEGSDANHPYGASSTAPASTYQYSSFEDVISQYNDSIDNHTSSCNAYGITAPKPYDQQVIYNTKPLWSAPDSCECSQIASMYANYQSVAGHYSSFSDYLNKSFQTNISDSVLTLLRNLCNPGGSSAPACNYLATPIQLPPVLQCGAGDICVGSTQFQALDSQFRALYPGVTPVADPSPTDSAQLAMNKLYNDFMNYRLGFSKSVDEYLTFLSTIHNPSHSATGQASCDSLEQLTAAYKTYRQGYLAPTISYSTEEGQNFPANSLVTNGYLALPDSIREKPSGWYNNIQFAGYGGTYCWSSGYAMEMRMKFLSNLVSGDMFYFYTQDFSCVFVRFINPVSYNGKTFPPGIYISSAGDNYGHLFGAENGSNGFDYLPVDNNLNGLLNWTSVKIKVAPTHYYVFYNNKQVLDLARNASNAIVQPASAILGMFGRQGAVDYIKLYDNNDHVKYFEDFTDPANPAIPAPDYFCPPLSSDNFMNFAQYFNSQKSVSYSIGHIDSLYMTTCGHYPDTTYPSFYDTTTISCAGMDSLLSAYKKTYLQPITNYADLDMRTFAGNITPADGPKGVFDVNGLLIGNTADGTTDQINSSFAQVWNSSSVNQQVGTLSTLSNGKFHLVLKPGQYVPTNGITGMRYYQFDIPYDTLDAVMTNLGSYIDFGDGQHIRVDSVYTSATTKIGTVFSTVFVNRVPSYYVSHIYPSTINRTVIVYHTDMSGIIGFENYLNAPKYLPGLKNLRGYAPQDLKYIRFLSTQDSSLNTLNGFANKNKLYGLEWIVIGSGDGGTTPFKNYNFGSFQGFNTLQEFRWEQPDSTVPRLNTILPNLPVNFPLLREMIIPAYAYSDSVDFSLPQLQGLSLSGLRSGQVDSILNQAGLTTTVDTGVIVLLGGARTSASDSAIARLHGKHWSIATQAETIDATLWTSKQVDTFAYNKYYPADNPFADFINSKFGSTMTWNQMNSLYLEKCGLLPNYTTPDSSSSASIDTDSCGNFSFIRTITGNSGDSLFDMVQVPDRGYLTAGVTHPASGGSDGFVAKTDRKGVVQWYKSYGSTGTDNLIKIRNTQDGGFIALGNTTSYSLTHGAPFVIKATSNGTVQWSRTLSAGTDNGEIAKDVIQTSDGGYAIAADYDNIPASVKWEIIRLDSSGGTIWSEKIANAGTSNSGGLLEDQDTLVFSGLSVGSLLTNGSGDVLYDGVLIKINKTSGAITWARSYNIDSKCNWFFDIHNTTSGYLINGVETNYTDPPSFGRLIKQTIVEVNKNGQVSRIRRIPAPDDNETGTIAVYPTTDGGYICTQGENDTANADIYIHKINSSGSVAWSNLIVLPGDQHITRVLQNTDGLYTAAGYSNGNPLILRLDSLGKTGCADSTVSFIDSIPSYVEYDNVSVSATSISLTNTAQTVAAATVSFTENTQCYNSTCPRVVSDTLFLCGRAAPVFTPVSVNSITNCSDSNFFAVSKSTVLYSVYNDSLQGNFDSSYRATCMQAYKYESFTVTHLQSEYHHTLYYYDQAGNLLKTVPPSGVQENYDSVWLASVAAARAADQSLTPAHGLKTQYRYNTLNQVIAQQTPDAGQSHFWYDRLGRLAISQNARQKANSTTETNKQYSYTLYDYIGRITEVGQISNAGTAPMTDSISRNEGNLTSWLTSSVANKEQITQTVYDLPYTGFTGLAFTPIGQRNLRNRVSYTSFTVGSNPAQYNQSTFYTYDIEGNVDTLLQDYGSSSLPLAKNIMNANGNRFKRMVYQYDLVSGKVNSVAYQPHQVDAFYHRYTYDAENRLTLAETSQDSVYWDKEARYEYYKHGPLARVIIGDKMVQGMDYAYTLQGWLKGVNSSSLTPGYDMGRDGDTTYQNRYIGRDAYGFSLNYYTGDYSPIGTSVTPFPGSSAYLNGADRPLFNGNISSMLTNIGQLYKASPYGGTVDTSHWRQPMLYSYRYDQLNRITGMDAYYGLNQATNSWAGLQPTQDFRERVSYDGNGNIQKYLRNNFGETGLPMDSLGYSYISNTNKLSQIRDSAADFVGAGYDLHSQPAGNYAYDSIGNLIKDSIERINSIKWNVYGKITEIDHATTTATKPIKNIYYYYDAAGNRVGKKTTRGDSSAASYTWYVRDASGNVMATYTASLDTANALDTADLHIGEKHIYGSSRLGIVSANYSTDATTDGLGTYISPWTGIHVPYYTGKKQYELTNHLGNVMATISDRKIGVSLTADSSLIDHYEADVQTAQDYYPFGMIMPGRLFTALTVPGGSVTGTTQVNGFTVPVDLSLSSRNGNEPTQYVATRTIDLDEGFESGTDDDVTAFLTDTSYAGTGNGGNGADGVAGTGKYPYTFNGKREDNDAETSWQDYGMREYDRRRGQFISVDPLTRKFAYYTPYQFAGNKPIPASDLDGKEEWMRTQQTLVQQDALTKIDETRIKTLLKTAYLSPTPYKDRVQEYQQEQYRIERYREAGYNDDGSKPFLKRLSDNKTWNYFAGNLALPLLDGLAIADGVFALAKLARIAPAIETFAGSRKVGFIRDVLGVDKTQNIGFLEGQIGNTKINDIAISGKKGVLGTVSMVAEQNRVFTTQVVGGYDRLFDSEVKLLENFAETYRFTPNIEGTLKLTSERTFCESCSGVVDQFKKMFPKVKLEYVNGTGAK